MMKFKFLSNKHNNMLQAHGTKIVIAAAVVVALLVILMYKRTMMADGSGAGQGALIGGLSGAAIGGAVGGGRGAGIGAGVGLLSGAMIGGASSRSSRSDVSPSTKRLNNIYKQIDKKQAQLDKVNSRIATAKESKRQSLMDQANQYQRDINDLQRQANEIAQPQRSQRQAMPMNNRGYGRMAQ